MKKISDIEFFKKRSVRIWAAVAAILIFLVGTGLLVWVLSEEMFTANPRFTLRHLRVRSHDHGFWKGKKELVCEILRIREGGTNLFAVNPGELRRRLLAREPSIQSVRIIRELPDTMYVEIVERMPVAMVNSPRSRLVVDSNTILMEKDRCMDIASTLPIILGLPNVSSYPPGSAIGKFEAAVNLVRLNKTSYYPDLRIGAINVSEKGQLICAVYYKDDKNIFRVVMPDRQLSKNLQVLVSVLEEIQKTGNPRRNINLLFRNQVIITGEDRKPAQTPAPQTRKKRK